MNPKSDDDTFNTLVVCPVCLKPGLKFVHEFTSGWATPSKRFCPFCNYNGILVLEIDKKEYYSVSEEERDEWLEKIRNEAFSSDEEDNNFDHLS